MATYHNITRAEMEEFLLPQGFVQIFKPGTRELIYARRLDVSHGRRLPDMPALSLAVYTGINPDGNSRDVGRDAMRVEISYRDRPILNPQTRRRELPEPVRVGGSKRVHRVMGWRTNLQDRIDRWQDILGPTCPLCGAPTLERHPKPGQHWKPFYSCARYRQSGCRGTRQMNQALTHQEH